MKFKSIALITGTWLTTSTICALYWEKEKEEALDELSNKFRSALTVTFNEGVKFGRLLQSHDNRML